ncbi:GFA family protein [Hyphomicrobium sp.]|uniref:GFA family protein n=1 Tax=Hyphomicrobium sp. TaxID=82 RepID=UPI001D8FDCCA|nr:GFA family protein [Hyphomicrobium sp.]MBY0559143.1 GFA family protein [Hyphomicrobium sp.]
MTAKKSGGCLCKSVRFEVNGTLNPIVACHCSQCAKTSGNFATMTSTAAGNVEILSGEALRWFQSSETGNRGFCSRCGSNLFWKQTDAPDIYITAGSLDKPTELKISGHIFVASKSDYYDITDGLPQKDEW